MTMIHGRLLSVNKMADCMHICLIQQEFATRKPLTKEQRHLAYKIRSYVLVIKVASTKFQYSSQSHEAHLDWHALQESIKCVVQVHDIKFLLNYEHKLRSLTFSISAGANNKEVPAWFFTAPQTGPTCPDVEIDSEMSKIPPEGQPPETIVFFAPSEANQQTETLTESQEPITVPRRRPLIFNDATDSSMPSTASDLVTNSACPLLGPGKITILLTLFPQSVASWRFENFDAAIFCVLNLSLNHHTCCMSYHHWDWCVPSLRSAQLWSWAVDTWKQITMYIVYQV